MKIVIAAMFMASPAFADPCAQREVELLRAHSTTVTYCPACGDKAPGEPMTGTDLDRPFDAASTYVQMSPYRYANLAALAGCPRDGIVPSLRVQGETPNGVLILPDDEPVEGPRTSDVGLRPEQRPLAEVRSPKPEAPSLWPWLGGGLAGALGSIVTVLMVARRKRHRAELPRALGLVDRR